MKPRRSTLAGVTRWIGDHRLEITLVLVTLALGAFFRLYRISEYMAFRGDEGRDALVVRRLLVSGDLILAGPATSIGDMVLGPLYYYLMAPALWVGNFSPVGPAVLVALTGVATIALVWLAGRAWFPGAVSTRPGWDAAPGRRRAALHAGALAAALLYAASPLVIDHARSAWNPNILPFWTLLAIYSIWRVWERLDFMWLVVFGAAFACALQSHYLAILLLPPAGLFWLLTLLQVRRFPGSGGRAPRSLLLLATLWGALVFLIIMSPLLLFDARQGWGNLKAISGLLSGSQPAAPAEPGGSLQQLGTIAGEFAARLIFGAPAQPGDIGVTLLLAATAVSAAVLLRASLGRQERGAFGLLLAWLFTGLLGLALVPGEVFDHYYTLLFPAPYLLLGGWVQALQNRAAGGGRAPRAAFLISLAIVAALLGVELANNPVRYPPGRQLQRTEAVARKIAAEAGGEPLNLAVIAERNYEDAYQYLLETWNVPVLDIDPRRPKATLAGQLFIVCEQPAERCDPKREPRAIVSKFGRSRIAGEWDLSGVTLYRLIPRP